MFSFGNGAINWSNKKQPTIALLSTKAKYISIVIIACEIICLQKLLSYLGQLVDAPIVIYYDNINSILLVNNLVYMLGQSTLRCTTTLLKKWF